MSSDAVQPGARVVWCLKRRATDVRCVVLGQGMPVEVQVVHGRDVVVTEMFQEEWMALKLGARLSGTAARPGMARRAGGLGDRPA